jgi:hypothetical protein
MSGPTRTGTLASERVDSKRPAKEGVYFTVGGGGIEDLGLRVSTTGAFGLAAGPTVEMRGPQFQFSFVSQTITF